MKTKTFLCCFFMLACISLSAQDTTAGIIFGDGTIGFDTADKDEFWFANVTVLPITVQFYNGLGFKVSPVVLLLKDDGIRAASFINPLVFYNLYPYKNITVGPFASVHALAWKNPNFFELKTGFLFSYNYAINTENNMRIKPLFELIQVQIGYKYFERKSSFYMQVGFDLIGLLYLAALGEKEKTPMKDAKIP